MNWILIALIGYGLLALTFILDKYILSSTTIERPSVYAFYSTIIMWAALVLLFFSKETFGYSDILIGLGSGVGFGFGLLTLYIAVKGGEASHVNPFSGAIVAVTTYILSHYFLSETLTRGQLLGMVCLVFASVVLSYQETKMKKGFSFSYVWAILSGICFAVSHVSAKFLYMNHDFIPAFAWTRAGAGVVGVLLLLHPHVWKELSYRLSHRKKSKKKIQPTSLAIVWIAKIVGIAAVVLIQYAGAKGSVSVVHALSGLQYALMFALIFCFSKWSPKTFKEYFSPRELLVQSSGIILVIIGGALFIL
ncbi:MAG TPA: EamA family transporter [Candidatus Magasanikbacteria bacterium]|nr:EamA family transporter [Candidatus Magasanikbacteria bacterium]